MKAVKIASTLLLTMVLGLAILWAFGSLVARPFNRIVLPPEPPARVVRLAASDGVPLAASYWPGADPRAPAILLLHGINSNRAMFTDNAKWLHGLGYAVLALDFRGHGGSGPAERSFGWREAEDAKAAFAFLQKEAPGRRVAVIGVSMGGAAALLGSEGPLPVDALVLHAVYPDLRTAILNRLNRIRVPVLAAMSEPLLSYQSWFRYGVAPDLIAPREGLRQFKGPVLVIGGADDRDTTPADTRSLYAAAPGRKSLWLVDDAGHVEVCKLRSDEYRARLRRFLAESVGEPRPSAGVI